MKFQCAGCGECCSNFDNSEIGGIPLLEWEKNLLEQRAIQLGLSLTVAPFSIFKIGEDYVAYEYVVKEAECPFLKENRCAIYEDRPQLCKQFPFTKLRFIPSEKKFTFELADCDAICKMVKEEILATIGKKALVMLKEYFGEDLVVSSLQSQFTVSKLLAILKQLGAGEPIGYVSLSKEQQEQITVKQLFSFCKKKGIISREWVKDFVGNHYKCIDAKSFLANNDLI